MEVKIKPVSGCAQILLGILTLGIFPLAQWLNLRGWPKALDESGLTTRGGTKIAWNEFTKVTKVITNIGRTGAKTEHYELKFPKGKIVVAPYRLENGDQVLEYVWRRLPAQAKG
jgi:hypothetical protein